MKFFLSFLFSLTFLRSLPPPFFSNSLSRSIQYFQCQQRSKKKGSPKKGFEELIQRKREKTQIQTNTQGTRKSSKFQIGLRKPTSAKSVKSPKAAHHQSIRKPH